MDGRVKPGQTAKEKRKSPLCTWSRRWVREVAARVGLNPQTNHIEKLVIEHHTIMTVALEVILAERLDPWRAIDSDN
jgi:hypothetical protein